MEQLPAELLSQIAVFCDKSSRFELSKTNLSLRNVVAPLIFEHVNTGFLPEHIERLADLAASPAAKHVRSLTANTETLPSIDKPLWEYFVMHTLCETREPFMERFYDGFPEEHETHDVLVSELSEEKLHNSWQNFTESAQAQQMCHRTGHVALLQRALQILKNLQSVILKYNRADMSMANLAWSTDGHAYHAALGEKH